MTNKEKYIKFCEKESIPIFSQYWWLDTVCDQNNWDVLLYEKGGKIIASMPYYITKKSIFTYLGMPKLTQTMGPYITYPKEQKYYKRLSWEKEIMSYFIGNLPEFDYFAQNFNHKIKNYLPFYWQGFKQTTRYTYVIENTTDINMIWNNLTSDTRKKIKKAEKNLKIIETDNIDKYFSMVKMSFDRQHLPTPYSLEFFNKLNKECSSHKSRKIYLAIDEQEQIHVAIYIVWDKNSVYLLSSGGNPKLRNSGAKNLLVWHALKFASEQKLSFDFEGSMMENIEIYNRSFGAVQKAFFTITKTNSKILKIKNLVKEIQL